MFGHSSGRDQRRTGCSFLVLWVQSQSLGISSICLWWYVHLQKYWLWPGRNRFLHYYFSNWREDAWLSISGIFKPVEIQKKKKLWNLFTSWLLCRSAIVILSLITSDAFCHLLVTNLHLADYQRSPNQWVIGVEDCGANPGNESTYKLIAWEESLLVTSVTSYMQRISATLTEYLPLGRTESEKDLSQAAGQIIPASVTIP